VSTKSPSGAPVARSPGREPRVAPDLVHQDLGSADYDVTWDLQRSLRERLLAGEGPCVLLTLEHSPAVITGGRRSDPTDLLTSADELERRGILLRNVERGGSWTWHGPGQLVAYPIVALRRWGLRVPDFVAGLEGAMLELTDWALRETGVDLQAKGWQLGRRCGFPGAWLQRPSGAPVKIGAVGVHFRRFVSLHGLAWNLDPHPWGFDLIQPCGLADEVTSVRRLCQELGGDLGAVPGRAPAAALLAEILPKWWGAGRTAYRTFE
jgi:lipoate-protein ligase B